MSKCLDLIVLTVFPSVLALTNPDLQRPKSGVRIRLYNLADVPAKTVRQAVTEASRIFGDVGIQIQWLHCPVLAGGGKKVAVCDEPWTGIDLSLSLTTFVLSGQQTAVVDSAFGFAAPLAQPSYAGVLWERVVKLAESGESTEGAILGHAMAHELGHVLLRSLTHAQTGIMSPQWRQEEFRRTLQGRLYFTRKEANAIRIEVARRNCSNQ